MSNRPTRCGRPARVTQYQICSSVSLSKLLHPNVEGVPRWPRNLLQTGAEGKRTERKRFPAISLCLLRQTVAQEQPAPGVQMVGSNLVVHLNAAHAVLSSCTPNSCMTASDMPSTWPLEELPKVSHSPNLLPALQLRRYSVLWRARCARQRGLSHIRELWGATRF